ncbi:MAG: hypothetical protein H0W67_02615 [Gemmatimonadales bacterium]|nr:hypothetical protein [Gemmatimonadales bacterium]
MNEDAGAGESLGRYPMPPRDDPGYDLAAAHALLRGADEGDTTSAESATGYFWADPALEPQMRQLLAEAVERGHERREQLAERYLRAVDSSRDSPRR